MYCFRVKKQNNGIYFFTLLLIFIACQSVETVVKVKVTSKEGEEEKYLCKGECNVQRERCNCSSSEGVTNLCSDYQETCLGQKPWVEEECATAADMKCPSGFESPPLILFSIDGFKAEYLYREETPNIWKLASCGVHAPYMRSIYPTSTFPNHHTISTGLYPESHGIIGNSMYDHDKEKEFYIGSPNTLDPFWWGGEPIWVTTSNQGKKSATYFWVGSDVNITRYPDYYFPYDGSVPNEERMYQALDWLDLPEKDRPSLIVLYMSNVDHAGHNGGPDSQEVNTELANADQMISILMNGLKLRGLQNCVNIIMLADHGMASQSCDRLTYIDQYGVNMKVVDFYGGPYGRVGKSRDKSKWDEFDAEVIENRLRCHHDEAHWLSYLKYDYFPKRFHYANHKRIEDVQLLMDDEWLVGGKTGSTTFCDGGMHGFDNEFKSMHALFTAHGPGFKRSFNTSEPFENIEVYNLMTDLLNLSPAPNNGTSGSLYFMMSNPKELDVQPEGATIAVCTYEDADTNPDPQGCIPCSGLTIEEANQRLDLSIEEGNQTESFHMPLGRPHVYSVANEEVTFCLLDQEDYVIAADINRKMPRYVSYTLTDKSRDLIKPTGCGRPDYRFNGASQIPCSAYTDDLERVFLFPPELSNGDAVHDAVISTNTVPMYAPAAEVWNYMSLILAQWATSYGGINVLSGPVFDYNFDGIADSEAVLSKLGVNVSGAPIPTHLFLVITRCANYDNGETISSCLTKPEDIETMTFVIPNYKVKPCKKSNQDESEWIPETIKEHVARIRDVELLTGISLFRVWTQSSTASQEERISSLRVKLRLPQFSSQWLNDLVDIAPITSEVTTSNPIEVTTSNPIEATTSDGSCIAKISKLQLTTIFILCFVKQLIFQ